MCTACENIKKLRTKQFYTFRFHLDPYDGAAWIGVAVQLHNAVRRIGDLYRPALVVAHIPVVQQSFRERLQPYYPGKDLREFPDDHHIKKTVIKHGDGSYIEIVTQLRGVGHSDHESLFPDRNPIDLDGPLLRPVRPDLPADDAHIGPEPSSLTVLEFAGDHGIEAYSRIADEIAPVIYQAQIDSMNVLFIEHFDRLS